MRSYRDMTAAAALSMLAACGGIAVIDAVGGGGGEGGAPTGSSASPASASHATSHSSSSVGGSGGPGPDDPYRACDDPECYTRECAFDGNVQSCCIDVGLTCAPICDGNVSMCPPAPAGFQVICLGSAGSWTGHCAVSCKQGSICPVGMVCQELAFGAICTWAEVP